ncbi:GCN5-related N-acetyltransferase [Legionella geestiana]|uniref:[Ribosomal protein bS18]-alanine N-acetyltransferase n=2 Tax=Legionella geestiana TaxID=45065 RepID=A0A0W0TN86_9GAMM|nr:ribosomal protein S18-alanine N-acetyltransferase [Legionella geestiana]KTC97063.1 GCN5-related N-acetyltransferase [Legionella geestiana]QBS11421.1 ribosomal-protein-alanine N-acetyltransferase [Legionella geestiana]QDQ38978.1 ribosomal-protein-alanine N-acetyltransferase [Legionella geestiana]STX53919.1 GCN5-related N-acetyltransferase [Legionella geestiana]
MITRVRAMQFSDVDAVYAIECAAHRAPWSRDILHDCVLVGYDCRVLAQSAEDKSEHSTVIGYLIARYTQEGSAHILNVCIAPDFQGKGYGQRFLKHFLKTLKRPGMKEIILEVRPTNPTAIHIYEKLGFTQAEVKEGYYNDVQGIEDALLLKKVL